MQQRSVYVTEESLREHLAGWPEPVTVCAGCRLAAAVDAGGYIRYEYISSRRVEYRLRESYWTGLRDLAADRYNPGVLFGLKRGGTCVVAKDPFAGWSSDSVFFRTKADNPAFTALHGFVHSLHGIVQIAASGTLFLALDASGAVHARPYVGMSWGSPFSFGALDVVDEMSAQVNAWEGIRRVLLAEPYLVIAQKHGGELLCAGSAADLFGTFGKRNLADLQSRTLTDACGFYGGESMHFAFLDDTGQLYCPRYPETEGRFLQTEGLDHTFVALREDGRIVSFQDGFGEITSRWPAMERISLGRRSPDRYDDLFLTGISAAE